MQVGSSSHVGSDGMAVALELLSTRLAVRMRIVFKVKIWFNKLIVEFSG